MSYILFFVHLIAALTCVIYSFKSHIYDNSNDILIHRLLWLTIALIMLLLGLNSQFSFIELLTQFGRKTVVSHNLYNSRAVIQNWLALTIFVAILTLFVSLKTFLRQTWLYHCFPLGCFILILVFNLIRALSLHEIDLLLKYNIFDHSLGSFLELLGASALILSLVLQFRFNSAGIFQNPMDRQTRFI